MAYTVTVTASPNANVTIQDPNPTDGRFSETLAPGEVRALEMSDSQFDNMKPLLDRMVTAGLITYEYHDGSASEIVNDSDVAGDTVSDALNTLKESGASFGWKYSALTADDDPGAGYFRLNNADPALATFMYISITTDDGLDASSVLSELRDQVDITIDPIGVPDALVLYECSGTPTDAGAYFKIPLTFDSQGPEPLPSEALCEITFISAFAHAVGGDLHDPSTLAEFNLKLSDATLDDKDDERTAKLHNISDDARHSGVGGATSGNLASLDANGLPADSGAKASDFEPAFSKNTAFNKDFGTTAGTVCEGNDSRLGAVGNILADGEPTGFPNRTDSTYSFVAGTQTFTIEPTGASFDYYIGGTKYTKSAPESIVIDDVEGIVFLYYDGATLSKTTTFNESLILSNALIAVIYWDSTNDVALMMADERHGINMPGMTHYYLHATRGTAWESGLAVTDLDVDQSGDLDVHAQLGYNGGVIFDEDLKFTIAGASVPAQIPVYYKDGSAGNWRRYTATNFPVRSYLGLGTNRLSYNQFTGGAWQETEVANNNFVLCHLFATNDDTYKVIAIQGENEYANISAARTGAEVEVKSLSFGGLPIAEFTPIATIIYQTSDSYGNSVKARTRSTGDGADYIDWRGSSGASSATISLPSTDYLLRAANDFTEFPQKTAPVNDDLLLLEDSEAGNAKKHATRAAVAGVFGQDAQREESLGESQTTLSSPPGPTQNKVTLTTPALTGTYRIAWGCMRQNNDKPGVTRLYNETDAAAVGSEQPCRVKDSADRYPPFGAVHYVVFTGASKTFHIQWWDVAGGQTQSIKNAWIEFWRWS